MRSSQGVREERQPAWEPAPPGRHRPLTVKGGAGGHWGPEGATEGQRALGSSARPALTQRPSGKKTEQAEDFSLRAL